MYLPLKEMEQKNPPDKYVFKVTSVGLDKIQTLNVTITIFTNAAFDIGNQAGIFVDNLDVQFCLITRDAAYVTAPWLS